ncbi:nitrate reductase [NADH]-like [Panicum virgatum]|uniref:nitrate reductase [NADH]-like n=1 Tax=Panicum virgatum TaxID=38727 RepID=UPI0019D6810B|nr:nitrate reductase [NADH]-like [Panicum virgatum]
MAEVREHASQDSAWIVVHGHIYDCSAYLKDHPGGTDSVLINAGADCTEEFDVIHSDMAKALLAAYCIGELVAAGDGSDSPNTAVICRSPPPAPVALSNPREKVPFRLVGRKELSRNVRLLHFALPAPGQVHL